MKRTAWIVAFAILAIMIGAGAYYLGQQRTDPKIKSASRVTTSTATPKTVDFAALMANAKSHFPTVTATKVYTEQTDPNNLLGKPHQYTAAAAFLDSRTNTSGDDWGADGGGGIEVYATEADATT